MRRFKKRDYIYEAIIWTFFLVIMVSIALQIASYKPDAFVSREIILVLLVIAAGLLDCFMVKRQMKACNDILERLQMKEDVKQ